MRPTNLQITAVLAVLYARHGSGVLTREDVEEAIRTLPNGAQLPRGDRENVVRVALAWLRPAGDRGFLLNDAALALIGFAVDPDLALTPEEDEQFLELLRSRSHDGTLDSQELTAVTRRFLEDVLAGADIPDELLETIVTTYVRRGTLVMSEDGGRYTVSV
jgi:hypothetical protein